MTSLDLIAFLFPPVIDLINRKIADTDVRFWVSVAFCGVVGAGTTFLTGVPFTVDAVAQQIFVYIGIAQLTYKGIYEDSKVQRTIRGI